MLNNNSRRFFSIHLFKITIYLKMFIFCFSVVAYDTERSFSANQVPEELKGINIDEKQGEWIDLNLQFYDDLDQKVRLEKYFNQTKPVLLTIVYYKCPNLCQLHLSGLIEGMDALGMENDFEFVSVSLDHTEKPVLAHAKKNKYIETAQNSTGKNWHLLTGDEKSILKLSDQVGFKFKWSESQKQYAHLPVAYVLTPKGQISRYLYGVEMDPKTLRLSLVEASQGRIGGLVERILLFCFQFDPRKNKYTLYAYNVMRASGVITVLLILLLLVPAWIGKRSISRKGQA